MPRQSSRLAAQRTEPQVPVVAWERFRNSKGWRSAQGMHKLFVGPTGCGKTILARMAARERRFVVVLGTKPRDSSLDGYVDEGYVRRLRRRHTATDRREAAAAAAAALQAAAAAASTAV